MTALAANAIGEVDKSTGTFFRELAVDEIDARVVCAGKTDGDVGRCFGG